MGARLAWPADAAIISGEYPEPLRRQIFAPAPISAVAILSWPSCAAMISGVHPPWSHWSGSANFASNSPTTSA